MLESGGDGLDLPSLKVLTLGQEVFAEGKKLVMRSRGVGVM